MIVADENIPVLVVESLDRARAVSGGVLTAGQDFGAPYFAARGSELAAAFTVVTVDRVRIRPGGGPAPSR